MNGHRRTRSLWDRNNSSSDLVLIHADLLNRNVFVRDNKISAVIDWGCALYGDFIYDLAWFSFWAPWYPAMANVMFRDEALEHYKQIGLAVPNLDQRLRCYEIHIGLQHIAYSAFRHRAARVEDAARRTMEVVSVNSDPEDN